MRENKADARRAARAVLNGQAGRLDLADVNAALVSNILRLKEWQCAKTVFAYCPFGQEVDISSLFKEAVSADKHIVFPICVSKTDMVAALPEEGEWKTNRLGIKEPVLSRAKIVPPADIELALVPGLAFDYAGTRLGRGAGYYDRYLAACKNAVLVGVCFDAQLVQCLPADGYDVCMHIIISEKQVITVGLNEGR